MLIRQKKNFLSESAQFLAARDMIDTEQAIIDTERKAGPNIRTLKAR